MKRPVVTSASLIILCVVGLSTADTLNLAKDEPLFEPDPLATAGEAGGSLLCGAAGGILLGAVGFVIGGGEVDFTNGGFQNTAWAVIFAGSAGYTAGSGLGAWSVGKLAKQRGSAAGAFIGSTTGLLVGAGIAALGAGTKAYPLIGVAFVAPPAGAVIGYNAGRPKNPAERASLNWERLGLPAVSLVRRADREGRVSNSLAFQVITARF